MSDDRKGGSAGDGWAGTTGSPADGMPRAGKLPTAPPCPFCEAEETELMNPFGSQLSVSTYWCRLCRSPFEVMKWR